MPAGRPTKYDPAMCEAVINAGAEGMTLAEMADILDIDRATLNEWRERHPEFSRAVKAGLDKAQAWWEREGRKATFGGVDGFNATSYIFQMKNRFREEWADRQLHGSDPENPLPSAVNVIDASKLSTDALREVLAAKNAPDA